MKKRYIILLSYCLLLFISCQSKNAGQDNTPQTAATNVESVSSTIATLTQDQIKTVDIQLGNIENKELTATIKANGVLHVPNNNRANATSLFSGVIKTLHVQIDQPIKKGQIVATITNPQFIQLQEEYLTIKSKITLAQQELTRQQDLNEGNAGAMKNLQGAKAELNMLQSRKASLQEQIRLMGLNPASLSNGNLRSNIIVTSPISGTVSNLFGQIGSFIDVSSPVAEIVDNNAMHLDLEVFEKDLALIKTGQTVHFTATNNPSKEYDATIFNIGTSFHDDSKTITVHSKVTGSKEGLINGMFITGIVSLSNVTRPAVPNEAIVNSDGKDYIFIVKGNGKDGTTFEKVEVARGVSDIGYTAITFVQDIPQNIQIVTKGAFFINAKLTGSEEDE